MLNVQCPNPAYNRLLASGLNKKILDKRELIHKIFLYDNIHIEGEYDKIEKKALEQIKTNPTINDKSEAFRDMLELENDLVGKGDTEEYLLERERFERVMLNHPSFLAYLVLGKELFNYKKFGFPTRKSLEESITSYCIGEERLFCSDNSWVWRTRDYKNEIVQNIHGDMYASQTNISGIEIKENTLFGEEVKFDAVKLNPTGTGISEYQDWSSFLIATLKYAKELGMEKIPEIINWKQVLEEIGSVGTATSECMFGSGREDWIIERIVEKELMKEEIKSKYFPISLYTSSELYFIPMLQGDRLVYFRGDEKGDVQFSQLNEQRFVKENEYFPEDIPELLKGIYRYFARDRSIMYRIMDFFAGTK